MADWGGIFFLTTAVVICEGWQCQDMAVQNGVVKYPPWKSYIFHS
jgi:hypothetical protein